MYAFTRFSSGRNVLSNMKKELPDAMRQISKTSAMDDRHQLVSQTNIIKFRVRNEELKTWSVQILLPYNLQYFQVIQYKCTKFVAELISRKKR